MTIEIKQSYITYNKHYGIWSLLKFIDGDEHLLKWFIKIKMNNEEKKQ